MNKRSNIKENISRVLIIQKHHQKTGQTTEGVVKDILTNAPTHPRGIKVRLVEGQIGRIHSFINGSEGGISCQNQGFAAPNNRQQLVLSDFLTSSIDISTDVIHEQIPCKKCTFLNSNLLENCEICNSKL